MGKFLNLLFYFGFAVSLVEVCNSEQQQMRLCGDPDCQKIISKATAQRDYAAGSEEKLSFKARDSVDIYSKPVDPKDGLWGVVIGNRRGLAPKDFLKEERVLVKKHDLVEVPVNFQKGDGASKAEPPELKSSIPSDGSETTTTAPLPNEPGKVEIAPSISREQFTVSPPQTQNKVLDGTQLPPGYDDVLKDEEGKVGIEDDIAQATTESSLKDSQEQGVIHNDNSTQVQKETKSEAISDQTHNNNNLASSTVENPESKENSTIHEIAQGSSAPNSSETGTLVENDKKVQVEESKDQQKVELLEQTKQDQRENGTKMDAIDQETTQKIDKASLEIKTEDTAGDVKKLSQVPPVFQYLREKKPDTGNVSVVPLTEKGNNFQSDVDETQGNSENVTQTEEGNQKLETKDVLSSKEDVPPAASPGTGSEAGTGEKLESNHSEDKGEQVKVSESAEAEDSGKDIIKSQDVKQVTGNETSVATDIADKSEQSTGDEISGTENADKQKEGEQNNTAKADSGESETTTEYSLPVEKDVIASPEVKVDEKNGSNSDNLDGFNKVEQQLTEHQQNENKGRDEERSGLIDSIKASESQETTKLDSEKLEQRLGVNEESDKSTENEKKYEATPSPIMGDSSAMLSKEENPSTVSYDSDEYTESGTTVPPEGDRKEILHDNIDKEHESEQKQGSDGEEIPSLEESQSEEKINTDKVKNNWSFSNVFDTFKNFWPMKDEQSIEEENIDDELNKILFPDRVKESSQQNSVPADEYCEKLTPNSCPSDKVSRQNAMLSPTLEMCSAERDFFSSLSDKVLEMVDMLACLLVTALTTLVFSFGYYCICHGRKEGALLSKLNIVERSLLASTKEAAILKHDLTETRNKLVSIEDNSFGSNDMVIALKRELQGSEAMKLRLQEQVASLEKELENAAEAGLELNKIVSELLNNQTGDESIISTVEELQKQLNEQQNTIFQINATLAEKSRENSELQLILTNQATKFQEEIQTLKQAKEDLQNDKILLEAKQEESKQLLHDELSKVANEKCLEIQNMGKEMSILKEKYDEVYRKLQASEARAQVLEECLNGVKNNAKFNIKDLIDAVNLKTEVMAIRRERDSLKERLEGELDARKLLEDHVKIISEEVSNLKREYNQSEKEKVEAQTRLEVLSSYFKEKETQLQKELSLKEAMWLKQQGETSSTVERVRHMQDEIQALKSQNDSLRAEIEAQAATHKTHIANLENRAHETWLAARQSERKLEEARTEATALRRKLTSIAGNSAPNEPSSQNRSQNAVVDGLTNDVNSAPSPVHMDSATSPLIGGLPPPLPFLPPPPFMAPPHPFMPMPPPFMPPGEMRPPPLGRLMSPPPPPPPDRYSPSLLEDRDRYSPPNGRYSPDNYNYTTDIMSNYDTETDFSPPPSPGVRSGGGGGNSGGGGGGGGTGGGYNSRERDRDRDRGRERNSRAYKPFSPPPPSNSDRNKKSKGILSSGSADSYDSRKSKGKGKV